LAERITELFQDAVSVEKIRKKLPRLFQLAELESQRAGKIGMEVGSIRERIIVSLLIHKFGIKAVETEIPITAHEADVKLYDLPISIKTITGKYYSGIKLIWTVDAENAREFRDKYSPTCGMIFVQIVWGATEGIFFIPKDVQYLAFKKFKKNKFFKLPKKGTNPRGVEMTAEALKMCLNHRDTLSIKIDWNKEDIAFNPFKKWIDLWAEE